MATVPVKKSTISVSFTFVNGETLTLNDSQSDKSGTEAWNAFLHGQTITDGEVYYPYHAVVSAEPNITTTTAVMTDEFCEDDDK